MTKELQKALIRTILCERDRIDNEIYKERKRIYGLAAGPMAAFEIDVKKLSSLYEEKDYCLRLLSALSEYYRPQKQNHLGKKAPFIVLDDHPITDPIETPVEKPKITHPTKEETYLFILRALISYHERMTMKESTQYDIYLESLRFAYKAAEEKIAAGAAHRPADADIHRIRKILTRAASLARDTDSIVNMLLYNFPDCYEKSKALLDIALLLESVLQAATEFNAAFPEGVRK